LQRMLQPFDDEYVVTPQQAAPEPDAWDVCAEPELPMGSTPVAELPPGHPALAYLASRGFDPMELWQRWQVHYCQRSPLTTPPFDRRLVIPVHDLGPGDAPRLAGWIARAITPGAEPKYLFNRGLRTSRLLYGMPQALASHGPVILVEGPADAWRIGVGAV